jgi:general secretion pathway protein F
LFPPIICHTISIGEMSGNVDEQLINIAQVYDNEIELTVRSLTSVIEPAVLLIMGLVVGFIVLAMLLPIFEINQMI